MMSAFGNTPCIECWRFCNVPANIAASIVRGADTLENLEHSTQLILERERKSKDKNCFVLLCDRST
jgi:hypothetical protein